MHKAENQLQKISPLEFEFEFEFDIWSFQAAASSSHVIGSTSERDHNFLHGRHLLDPAILPKNIEVPQRNLPPTTTSRIPYQHIAHLRAISHALDNDQETLIDMSEHPDPVIGRVLGELRKAANEGESATFYLPKHFPFIIVLRWREEKARNWIDFEQFYGVSSGISKALFCAALVYWSSSCASAGLESSHVTISKWICSSELAHCLGKGRMPFYGRFAFWELEFILSVNTFGVEKSGHLYLSSITSFKSPKQKLTMITRDIHQQTLQVTWRIFHSR